MLIVEPPIYLMLSSTTCYKCGHDAPVVGLASKSIKYLSGEPQGSLDSYGLLSTIDEMPAALLELIQRVVPEYQMHRSNMRGRSYFTNCCPCGANFGDWFLFTEPDGAFWPTTDEGASNILVCELPLSHPIEVSCTAGYGPGDYIFDHALRQTYDQLACGGADLSGD